MATLSLVCGRGESGDKAINQWEVAPRSCTCTLCWRCESIHFFAGRPACVQPRTQWLTLVSACPVINHLLRRSRDALLRNRSTIRSAANFRPKIASDVNKNRDLGMTLGDLAALSQSKQYSHCLSPTKRTLT